MPLWVIGISLLIIICLLLGWYIMSVPGKSYQGEWKKLTPLEQIIHDNLKHHVYFLAGKLGERNVWHRPALDEAIQYISKHLQQSGWEVEKQIFATENIEVANVIVRKQGTQFPEKILVLGAHYDSVLGVPGADDNASGVAALLVLAVLLGKKELPCSVHLVAFVNEEPPFFGTANMGSLRYARALKEQKAKVIGMISLESIGYYTSAPNSQRYPWFFRWVYPATGDFLAIIANLRSRHFLHTVVKSFRKNVQFASVGIASPPFIPGVDWSDQWAFWKQGYPALMLTDSALYRNPHYHTPTDLPDTLDYDRFARVVAGLSQVVAELLVNETC